MAQTPTRRRLIEGGAALTSSLFSGQVRGANDRLTYGVIGLGQNGFWNMKFAMERGAQIVGLCDVYQPQVDRAMKEARSQGHQPKTYRDFRQMLLDPAIDIIGVHAPDHWHALMMVEACKAGKDVFVEKPVCRVVDEGALMLEAARKYKRVVQCGLQHRSGDIFQKAAALVRGGQIGKVSACKAWNYFRSIEQDLGNPPDSAPPPGLDYDMWLGPAPARAYNENRFLAKFRWFWDYAGGMMGDWGVHWIDTAHFALGDPQFKTVCATGGKFVLRDARDTPDTASVLIRYEGCVLEYEYRFANSFSPAAELPGISFHGDLATLVVTRKRLKLIPEAGSGIEPLQIDGINHHNLSHWDNFLACVRSRKTPASGIETSVASTTAALLGNVSLRCERTMHWDPSRRTVEEPAAQPYLRYNYRAPWRLEVQTGIVA